MFSTPFVVLLSRYVSFMRERHFTTFCYFTSSCWETIYWNFVTLGWKWRDNTLFRPRKCVIFKGSPKRPNEISKFFYAIRGFDWYLNGTKENVQGQSIKTVMKRPENMMEHMLKSRGISTAVLITTIHIVKSARRRTAWKARVQDKYWSSLVM